jgi:hypothetical protein
MRMKRETDHSPTSANVKNAWNIISAPFTHRHGMVFKHRDNFNFAGISFNSGPKSGPLPLLWFPQSLCVNVMTAYKCLGTVIVI